MSEMAPERPALGTARVIRADARHLPLADNSVDLCISSPPYWSLRSYQDNGSHYDGQIGSEPTSAEFLANLLDVMRECVRVTKPAGSIFWNLGDKYLPNKSLAMLPERFRILCADELGLICRSVIIWSKPNGLPESVTDRVRRSHEDWMHFTLEPRYFSAVDEIREEHMRTSWQDKAWREGRAQQGPRFDDRVEADLGAVRGGPHPLGKLPGSVWNVPTEPLRVPDHLGIDHFAAFPTEWPKRIIRGWTESGMTVLDPFGGTGTTAMVAKALGRHGISVDMSADYCRLAEWRTNDRDQLAKVLGFEKVGPVDVEQLQLFDDEGAA